MPRAETPCPASVEKGGNNAGNDKYPSPGGRDLRQHKMDEEQAADCRDKAENKHSRFHLF